MHIDSDECTGCGQCIPYCPVGAITMVEEVSEIDFDECTECGNCLRLADCPVDTIFQQELEWPRTVRSIFSDPLTIVEESDISGRGTEEMKTNEVTGRFEFGFVGVAIEFGRPILGARFYDIEKVAQAVSTLGIEHERENPTTSLISDPSTGTFKEDILQEKVLSAILEFKLELEKLPELFEILKKVSKEIDTVFSLDIATRVNPDGSIPTAPFIETAGLWVAPNGKTNVGLGRPRYQEDSK